MRNPIKKSDVIMKKVILSLFAFSLILFLACTPSERKCTQDADCVPASCCHASDAVNKDHGPDCTGQLCTLECQENTIDCGQGKIKCVESECQVVLKRE